MLGLLANRTYRHLFCAQVIALLGTGLATVALGLLAFDLAGERAGAVLGTALAIKMVAYVVVAPVAAACVEALPRRAVLVTLDVIRAGVAVMLPFVSEIWHVYILIFLLQGASAAFTPAFQATLPDVLPDENDYTRALSLSRLAYDLESLASPALAAILLTVVSFQALFLGTVAGFLASAALVVSVVLPRPPVRPDRDGLYDRTTRGIRIYLATPRLRGLLALCLVASAAGSMVIVNTVVLVQSSFGLGPSDTALALAAFGGGSMVAALLLPQLLERFPDRGAMLTGAGVLVLGLGGTVFLDGYPMLLPLWAGLGIGYAIVQTPAGRLLRRSAHPEDRPALFAAHFALSHVCWLVTYPLAGWGGAVVGLGWSAGILCGVAALGLGVALWVWPRAEAEEIDHTHADLAPDDPHLFEGHQREGKRHSHVYVIDRLHREWPLRQGK